MRQKTAGYDCPSARAKMRSMIADYRSRILYAAQNAQHDASTDTVTITVRMRADELARFRKFGSA